MRGKFEGGNLLEVNAPGKMMLSGEWSVLEQGMPCIVLAVDKRVRVRVEKAGGMSVSAEDLGIGDTELVFDGKRAGFAEGVGEETKGKLNFVRSAAEMALRYLHESGKELEGFRMSTHSPQLSQKMAGGGVEKLGFGGSAAIVVAVVAALLKLAGEDLRPLEARERIYKLGCAAHYFAQGRVGSAFDVAASAYGGALVYRRFDEGWLTREIESGKGIREIVAAEWRGFEARPIKIPKDMRVLVAFTGKGASTKELVLKMREFREKNAARYWEIINGIGEVTEGLISALGKGDKEGIKKLIRKNRRLLKMLSDKSGNELETGKLAALADIAEKHGASGKFSGAGGGDFGIAVCFDARTAGKITRGWKVAGLYPLDVGISKEGVI